VEPNAALPSGYEVYIDGGRTATGADAIEWAKKVDGFGVSVIAAHEQGRVTAPEPATIFP
jgi:imidazole glycerol phosphate synthase subunit HisF